MQHVSAKIRGIEDVLRCVNTSMAVGVFDIMYGSGRSGPIEPRFDDRF